MCLDDRNKSGAVQYQVWVCRLNGKTKYCFNVVTLSIAAKRAENTNFKQFNFRQRRIKGGKGSIYMDNWRKVIL